MTADTLFGLNVLDFTDQSDNPPNFFIHLPCLNKHLHHKHAIHNMKFDPDGADFDLGQL